MKDKLAKLIDVKTIVTLVVIVVFAILALTHVIDSQNVMSIVTMVVAFYFGTQHAKKDTGTDTAGQTYTDTNAQDSLQRRNVKNE